MNTFNANNRSKPLDKQLGLNMFSSRYGLFTTEMERRNDRLNKIKLIAGDTAADIFFERAHVCECFGFGW